MNWKSEKVLAVALAVTLVLLALSLSANYGMFLFISDLLAQ